MENKIFPVRQVKCKTRRCSVMWCNNPATDIYTKGIREVFSGHPVRLCKSCAEEIGRLAGLVKPEEIPVPAADDPEIPEPAEESAEPEEIPVPAAEPPKKRGGKAAK